MFRLLFERSADPIWLLDPRLAVFVDCNAAAVKLMRAPSKARLLRVGPADLSPEFQPDGRPSAAAAAAVTAQVEAAGAHRFEWVARRLDGTTLPLEVTTTRIEGPQRVLHVVVSRDISDRKRAEAEIQELNNTLERRIGERTAELQRSEERFRTLVEEAPEAIVVFDGETGRFLQCNENACRLYGLPRGQLLGRHPADVSPRLQPDGRSSLEAAAEKIRRVLAGETLVFEWLHQRADGRLVSCEVRLVRLPSEGRPLVRGSVIDNTERRRREQIQRATYAISEAVHEAVDLPALYREIHAIIAGLMPARNFYLALHDPKTERITFPCYVDERGEAPPDPIPVGTGLTSYVLRTGRPLLVDAALNARKRRVGDRVTFEGFEELEYVESGRPAAIWVGVPLRVHGRTMGVMAVQDYEDENAYGEEERQVLAFVARQIAVAIDRKQSEQALRESEARYRVLFEASSQGVIIHDSVQYLEANPAAVRMFGCTRPEDLVGRHPRDTSPPTQPDGTPSEALAQARITECLERGTARFEWMSRTAQGREIPLEVILTRVEMGGRQLIQAVMNDISERKQTEAELQRTLARERELSQLKGNFVSMVSHEFRTPLGIIASSAEILADYLDQLPAAERREHLDSITQNVHRMADMMEEVLVLGRLDAGGMAFQPVPIELGAVCARLVDEVASATGHCCPIRLEPGDVPGEARADPALLHHLLANLLTNAVKYSNPGQPVFLTVARDGSEAVLTVRDQGIGIPEEDQPWLFTTFHRGRNVGHRPGTGLGLVIVKRCVELHRGHLQLESRPGAGTRVTVRLPVFPPLA